MPRDYDPEYLHREVIQALSPRYRRINGRWWRLSNGYWSQSHRDYAAHDLVALIDDLDMDQPNRTGLLKAVAEFGYTVATYQGLPGRPVVKEKAYGDS